LVWLVATYGCESWTLKTDEENRLNAFEMESLRQVIMDRSKTNSWVMETEGVERERLAEISEEEKNDTFWARHAKRWRMFGEGDHSRKIDSWVKRTWQTKATSYHGPDSTWNGTNATASEIRIPVTERRGVSSFIVRPTLGARRMVKEEEALDTWRQTTVG